MGTSLPQMKAQAWISIFLVDLVAFIYLNGAFVCFP
jgi:hypothetical protein